MTTQRKRYYFEVRRSWRDAVALAIAEAPRRGKTVVWKDPHGFWWVGTYGSKPLKKVAA